MKTWLSSIAWVAILVLAACEGATILPTTHESELDRMINAAATATESARHLNNVAARATSRADATREAVILQGQQTRLAQEAIQTQTVFAQNIAATATMHSAHSTATASAAQFTATANAINIEQTRVSARATVTAHAASAQRTRESGNATATRESEDARTLAEKQQWERTPKPRARSRCSSDWVCL